MLVSTLYVFPYCSLLHSDIDKLIYAIKRIMRSTGLVCVVVYALYYLFSPRKKSSGTSHVTTNMLGFDSRPSPWLVGYV